VTVRQIREWNVVRLCSPPFFVERIADFLAGRGEQLPTVENLALGGAPVSRKLSKKIHKVFPAARAFIVYGSTEAEPISSHEISGRREAPGKGHLVGKAVKGVEVEVVKIPPGLQSFDERGVFPYRQEPEKEGEIIVKGFNVVREYIDDHPANRELKIKDRGAIWHRTGDWGYLDRTGQLWITGRRADLIRYEGRTISPYPVEEEINQIEGVERSAVVQKGKKLFLFLELASNRLQAQKAVVMKEVRKRMIQLDSAPFRLRLLESLPLDRRHFSKLDRARLRSLC
jgi:acyl-CoA synthetase (AMP-forming)/AMP-acid ligase II